MMRLMIKQSRGFSLAELVIAVAIIAVLAAVAVPNFMKLRLTAKHAEVPNMVEGIKTAELSYDAAFQHFIATDVNPAVGEYGLGGARRDFDCSPSVAGWAELGVCPDGRVRGRYWVETSADDFLAVGQSDLDDDSKIETYTASKLGNAALLAGRTVYP